MSKVCDLTGKKVMSGNHVSHAKNKVKRKFYPNLNKKRFYIPETDQWVTLKVSSKAIRTIDKLGLYQYLKKLEKKGVNHGVQLNEK
ncbi:MAG TPA: 50S ribosomal protein L28 [Saprospiraceae bacterium]|nr:50S ribosomal protein L28 [Saprospiraceae bacterium]